ncbi:MAG: hypothetical protein LQ350_008016 [Teloschistes chrysophthalmus]|nr:MAG: hypothetical protein LQ350_008016 [Niorma chrysophthalma]
MKLLNLLTIFFSIPSTLTLHLPTNPSLSPAYHHNTTTPLSAPSLQDRFDIACHTLPLLPAIPSRIACESAGRGLCLHISSLAPAEIPRERWTWNNAVPQCAAGIYLGPEARVPSRMECQWITGRISFQCAAREGVNVGTNNVEVLPTRGGGDGRAVNEGFAITQQLLDYLTSINPKTELPLLRHISIKGYPLPVYPDADSADGGPGGFYTYDFEHVLPLFPGLQLSTLRIEDPWMYAGYRGEHFGKNAVYHSIQTYIFSQGFRELKYVVAHDDFMKPETYIHNGVDTTNKGGKDRQPQPSTCDNWLKGRDGPDSGANVTMFRVLDSGKRIQLTEEFEAV